MNTTDKIHYILIHIYPYHLNQKLKIIKVDSVILPKENMAPAYSGGRPGVIPKYA